MHVGRNSPGGNRKVGFGDRWQRLDDLFPELTRRLKEPSALLIGESGILSTCVHMLQPGRRGTVSVFVNRDAGEVFYHRCRQGEILHLDVFHEDGAVHPRRVALRLQEVVEAFRRDTSEMPPVLSPDHVDIQTGVGGGRITGSLRYGRRPTILQSHRNHVHVALYARRWDFRLLFQLAEAVERAIRESGLELRKVEGIRYEEGSPSPGVLSHSTAATDSLLKVEGGGTDPFGESMSLEEMQGAAVTLLRQLESLPAAGELLRSLEGNPDLGDLKPWMETYGLDPLRVRRALDWLENERFLEPMRGRLMLTSRGRAFIRYVSRHRYELKLALRKAVLRMTRKEVAGRPGRGRVAPFRRSSLTGSLRSRRAVLHRPGLLPAEMAWPETVLAAAGRCAFQTSAFDRKGFHIRPSDLRIYPRRGFRRVDMCLLIDASASMAGARMRAAKTLARHLLLTTRDRVAVIVFQERQVRISVEFTRNHAIVEEGLASIRPYGLTPMASGLAVAWEYVRSASPRNPLVLLITDGIPTVPHQGKNPLDDAIRQARQWKKSAARFACIGLQPNARYLEDLVREAGGTLHVVDELNADDLAAIAEAERSRRVGFVPSFR